MYSEDNSNTCQICWRSVPMTHISLPINSQSDHHSAHHRQPLHCYLHTHQSHCRHAPIHQSKRHQVFNSQSEGLKPSIRQWDVSVPGRFESPLTEVNYCLFGKGWSSYLDPGKSVYTQSLSPVPDPAAWWAWVVRLLEMCPERRGSSWWSMNTSLLNKSTLPRPSSEV